MAGSEPTERSGVAAAVAGVEDPRLFHAIGQLGLLRDLEADTTATRIAVSIPR